MLEILLILLLMLGATFDEVEATDSTTSDASQPESTEVATSSEAPEVSTESGSTEAATSSESPEVSTESGSTETPALTSVTEVTTPTEARPTKCPPDTATVCSNTLSDEKCEAIFTDASCDNEFLVDEAQKCRKYCETCCELPEYSCSDELKGGKCASFTRHCNSTNDSLRQLVQMQCPATCGVCASTAVCEDEDSQLCADLGKQLCTHFEYHDLMAEVCKKTCGICDQFVPTTTTTTTSTTTTTVTTTTSSESCVDVATNCAQNAALCWNQIYFELMTQLCAKTCNRCVAGATCADANPSCAVWVANNFCNNPLFTVSQRREFCARSCNLCN